MKTTTMSYLSQVKKSFWRHKGLFFLRSISFWVSSALAELNMFQCNTQSMKSDIYFCISSLHPKEKNFFQRKIILVEFRNLLEPSYQPSRKSCLLGPERREDGAETKDGCNGWWAWFFSSFLLLILRFVLNFLTPISFFMWFGRI